MSTRIPQPEKLEWLKFERAVPVEKFQNGSALPIPELLQFKPDIQNKELDENPVVLTRQPSNEAINPDKVNRQYENNESWRKRNQERKQPRQYDWLVLEGYVENWVCHARGIRSRFPLYLPMANYRNCVLRLNDLARGIQWALRNPNGGLNARPESSREIGTLQHKAPPDGGDISQHNIRRAIHLYKMNNILGQLVYSNNRFEKLIILAGEVPEDAKPGDFEEFKPPFADGSVSTGDRSMINDIDMELKVWRSLHDEWVDEFLASDEGESRQIKDFKRHAKEFRRWLGTPRGRRWLGETAAGLEWLQTKQAREWLAWTDKGDIFLTTPKGVEWLNAEGEKFFGDGKASEFLSSDYAKGWARRIDNPKKHWYSTPIGERWWLTVRPCHVDPPRLRRPAWKVPRAEEKPPQYEFHTNFDSDPRSERLSDLFIHIPEEISFVRYRGGYQV